MKPLFLFTAMLFPAALVVAGEPFVYQGGELPKAAAPQLPWKTEGMPESLQPLLRVAQELFVAGWADPREGEYREIVISCGNLGREFEYPETYSLDENPDDILRRKGVFLSTHGWVLPVAGVQDQRYAVTWDGLVYPVISVGSPASVAEDVKQAMEVSADGSANPLPSAVGPVYNRVALSKVVMLLRLQMWPEAEEMLHRWSAAARKANFDKPPPDAFEFLAGEWMHAQFERSLWAHATGQPRLALAYLEPTAAARSRLEETAVARGSMPRKNSETGEMDGLDLAFLHQVPALIADEKRRIAENITNRPEIRQPDSIPDKKQRIALLIRDLEEVEGRVVTMPGYLSFMFDPVVQRLSKQGEDAVDSLLDCLENDTRLTRTVEEYSRQRWRHAKLRIVGVEEPAFAALQSILKSREQLPNLDAPYINHNPLKPILKHRELAKAIRAYWEKYRGKPLAERWYGLLADDDATPRAWAEAAENLTLKESKAVPVYEEMVFNFEPEPGVPDPMRGEVLRGKTDPSISEFMARRLKQVFALEKNSTDFFIGSPSQVLAKALVKWDGKNQIETLRWYGAALEKKALTGHPWDKEPLAELIRIYLARKECGDSLALSDYVQWFRQADTGKLAKLSGRYGPYFLAPLWCYPDEPSIAELTKQLFADPDSPWVARENAVNPTWMAGAAITPLMTIPAFRELLLKHFKNDLVVGVVETVPPWRMMTLDKYARNDEPAGTDLLTGPKQDLRLCDKIAWRLSQTRGVPAFFPQASREKRDAAIDEIAAFVRKYGDRWTKKRADFPFEDDETRSTVVLTFPLLNQPATKEDVTAGRAIFSQENAVDRRVWPIPVSPVKPKWITLKDYPNTYNPNSQTFVVSPPNGSQLTYDQEVEIWQAEEGIVNGKWQRMFGVVAKNQLAMVPADEIQFDPNALAGDGWDLWGLLLGGQAEARKLPGVKLGAEVKVKIDVRNKQGAPRTFVLTTDEKSADAKDMEAKVEYFPGPLSALSDFFGSRPQWERMDPRGPLQLEDITKSPTVATLGKADLLTIDLSKAFDFSRPGIYRTEFTFKKDGITSEKHIVHGPMFEVRE